MGHPWLWSSALETEGFPRRAGARVLHGIKRSVYHESIVVHDLPSTASHLRIKKMGLFDNHRHNFLQMVVMQVSVVNCSVVSGHLNGTDRTGLTCLERSLQ